MKVITKVLQMKWVKKRNYILHSVGCPKENPMTYNETHTTLRVCCVFCIMFGSFHLKTRRNSSRKPGAIFFFSYVVMVINTKPSSWVTLPLLLWTLKKEFIKFTLYFQNNEKFHKGYGCFFTRLQMVFRKGKVWDTHEIQLLLNAR